MTQSKNTAASIIPALRYQDAPKAIDWLCRAFGFEKHLVVPGENGGIDHAQLTFGNGMIMLGSAGKHSTGYDKLMRTPGELGGANSQAPYVIVEDADAHHTQALAAGAEIVIPLEDAAYGGRGYTCRDLEGNVWSFGSYDPWTE
jgi:uncharacterized glyoxalase superfamily protein PhnB